MIRTAVLCVFCVCSPAVRAVSAEPPEPEPPEEIIITLDDSWHRDDGRRDPGGECLDQIMVFSGKPSRCLPPGKSTRYRNCCKNASGDIYFDSSGSGVETAFTSKTLTATLKASAAGVKAASAALKAGATAAEASQAGALAAKNMLAAALNPASIIIAVAVAVIMDYLMQGCDQQSMETAMLNSSGYCVYVGRYCRKKKRFFGCVQKAKSFCCFNSKLARIFHEQGRKQLKSFSGRSSFGVPKAPNCRGFTPEEFQSLDFAKIDLTEYMEKLKLHSADVIHADINEKTTEVTRDEIP